MATRLVFPILAALWAVPACASPMSPADAASAAASAIGLGRVTYDSISGDRGSYTVVGLRAFPAGIASKRFGPGEVMVASMSVEGAERAADGVRISAISFEGLKAPSVSVQAAHMTDVSIPDRGAQPRYGSLRLREASFAGGKRAVRMSGMDVEASDWVGPVPRRQTVRMRDVTSTFDRDVAKATGVGKIDVDFVGSYDPEASRSSVDDLTIWLGDKAALKARFAVKGVTGELLEELEKAATAPEVPAGAQRTPEQRREGGRLMSLLGLMEIELAEVRLENKGLVEGLLAASARSSGKPVETVVEAMVAGAREKTAKMKDRAWAESFVSAWTTFVKAPRSLALTVSPPPANAKLGTMMMLVVSGGVDANALGASVKANQP